MGMPKINLASLQCPQCAGLTRLSGIDATAGNERFSFECGDCGSFEVLALMDGGEDAASDRYLVKPGTESQDLWA